MNSVLVCKAKCINNSVCVIFPKGGFKAFFNAITRSGRTTETRELHSGQLNVRSIKCVHSAWLMLDFKNTIMYEYSFMGMCTSEDFFFIRMDQVKGVLTVQGEALTQAVCLTTSWK